jgi:SAM-dependent methyltransferase
MSADGYTAYHRHVLGERLPPLLAEHVEEIIATDEIVDVGCGDGSVIFALMQRGARGTLYAVDHAHARVERAATIAPSVRGVVGDATAIPLPDGAVGGAICSQVIEHVPDQDAVARELARVVGPDGWFYLASVARKPHGWWAYRRDGRWWLDPTHVREYRDVEELRAVAERNGLTVLETKVTPLRFAVADLALRVLVLSRLLKPETITRVGAWRSLRRARIPVPGYSAIELWGRRGTGQ